MDMDSNEDGHFYSNLDDACEQPLWRMAQIGRDRHHGSCR